MNLKTLKRCSNVRIDKEMRNIVDTVGDRIQNAIFTAIDSFITPKIELAISSINASSGLDATSVIASSERGGHIRIAAPLENESERNNTLLVLNTNNETWNKILDKVRELSVPDTHFDRQPHTQLTVPPKLSFWIPSWCGPFH